MTHASDGLAVGDYVTIADGPGALTWQIVDIHPHDSSAYGPLYALVSGQSNRTRYERGDKLTPFARRVTS